MAPVAIHSRLRDRRTGEVFAAVGADATSYTLHGETTRSVRYEPIGSDFKDYDIVHGPATASPEHRAGVISDLLHRQADHDATVHAAILAGRSTRAEIEARSRNGVLLGEHGDVLPETEYPGADVHAPRRRFFSSAGRRAANGWRRLVGEVAS